MMMVVKLLDYENFLNEKPSCRTESNIPLNTDELQALLCRLLSFGSDIERVELVMEDEGSPNRVEIFSNIDLSMRRFLIMLFCILMIIDAGLGPMPPMISSVGSVLVFNSSTDPRKGYHTMDNLVSSGR